MSAAIQLLTFIDIEKITTQKDYCCDYSDTS